MERTTQSRLAYLNSRAGRPDTVEVIREAFEAAGSLPRNELPPHHGAVRPLPTPQGAKLNPGINR